MIGDENLLFLHFFSIGECHTFPSPTQNLNPQFRPTIPHPTYQLLMAACGFMGTNHQIV